MHKSLNLSARYTRVIKGSYLLRFTAAACVFVCLFPLGFHFSTFTLQTETTSQPAKPKSLSISYGETVSLSFMPILGDSWWHLCHWSDWNSRQQTCVFLCACLFMCLSPLWFLLQVLDGLLAQHGTVENVEQGMERAPKVSLVTCKLRLPRKTSHLMTWLPLYPHAII